MKRATAQILGESSRVIVGTNRLADRVLHINPRLRVSVVPGSIDVDLYPVLPHPAEPVVGLIGSMNWYPSHSAADRVMRKLWPEIHRMVPDSRLIVAGRGSSEKLAHHFPLAGAELLGTVARPEDFFSSISVLLYPPTRGSGIKIKVLEAMAYGRAVVSNAEGLEGFGDRGEIVAVQAETDDEFIEHTVSLLNNPQRRAALGSAGRSQVAEVYSVQTGDRSPYSMPMNRSGWLPVRGAEMAGPSMAKNLADAVLVTRSGPQSWEWPRHRGSLPCQAS